MNDKEKRDLLIAYEKHHCHPLEWAFIEEETIELIDKFLQSN